MLVADGDTLTVWDTDSRSPEDADSDQVGIVKPRTATYVEFVNSSWELVDTYLLGSDIGYVVVTDADRNRHPLIAETVQVTIYSLMTGDSVVLMLTETGDRSGVFVNWGGFAMTCAALLGASPSSASICA